MAIEIGDDDGNDEAGQLLYTVIVEEVHRLKSGEQLTLGFAIQKATPWEKLSPDQRRALCRAAEQFEGGGVE